MKTPVAGSCEWSTTEGDTDPCAGQVLDDRLHACTFHSKIAEGLIDGWWAGGTYHGLKAYRKTSTRAAA